MKKKLIALILAAMSITALAACNKKQEEKPSGDDTPVNPQPGGDDTPVNPQPGGDDTPVTPEALPAEYDLMNYWAGNENEEAYAVAKQGDNTVITYTDVTGEYAGGWEYVKRSFQYDTRASEFSVYKKILFRGKLETTSGTNIVMVKVEGTDNNQYEKKFTFGSEVKTYELGLNFIADWTKVSQILFFVNRETNESGSGKITLEKFVLSQEEVVAENDIAPGMPAIPQGYALYDGVPADNKVPVMHHWGYASAGHINTAEANGQYTFSWAAGEKAEYEWVHSHIKNSRANLHESGLLRLVFNVTGTEGVEAIFKFESEQTHKQIEKKVALTGAAQEVEIDITGVLVEGETSFMAMIMPEPGKTAFAAAGQIVLASCYMDKTAVTPEPQPVVVKNNVLYPHAWLDKEAQADECYTIENNETTHVTTIAFDHGTAGEHYNTIKYKMELAEGDSWFGIENYRKVFAKLSADVNVQILLKAYDAVEKRVDLVAGEAQYVEFEVAEDKVDINKDFIVFVGTSAASAAAGNVTIEGLRVARMNAVSEQSEGVARINVGYAAAADGYTISKNSDGDMEIEWTATASGYRSIELFVSTPNAAALNTLKAKLTSTADVHVLFKPANEGGNEMSVALQAGVERGVNRTFSAKALGDGWDSKFVMFICTNEGDALSGKVTFKDFRLTDGTHDTFAAVVDDPDPDPAYMNYANYQSLNFDKIKSKPDAVTAVNENHVTTFTFEDLAPSWGNGVEYIGKLHEDISWAEINDYNHFHAVVKASVAMKIMLKPFNDNTLEQTISLPANTEVPLDLDVPAAKLDFSKPCVLFINPDVDGAAAVTGTLVVKYMQFARQGMNFFDGEKVEIKNFATAVRGNYTKSHDGDGKLVIAYEKTAVGYDSEELFYTGHDLALNKVEIEVTSTEATHMIVKALDKPANEQNIALEAGVKKSVTFFLDQPTDAIWGKMVLMIGVQEGDALAAELTFDKFELSHADPMAQPKGTWFMSVSLKAAVGGGTAPLFVKVNDDTADISLDHTTAALQVTLKDKAIKSFNVYTGKLVVDGGDYGDISMIYDPATGKMTNFGLSGTAAGLLEYNGYQNLVSNFKYWDCNGTTSELQAIWNRRYGNPWSLDGPGGAANNADRVTQDTTNFRSGSGLKLRAYSSDRFALAMKDFDQAYNCKNLSFWVYNPSESDVSIQVFGYTATGYNSNFTIKGTTAIHQGWTYISAGWTAKNVYAFQVFVAKTSTQLTFDDFVLF